LENSADGDNLVAVAQGALDQGAAHVASSAKNLDGSESIAVRKPRVLTTHTSCFRWTPGCGGSQLAGSWSLNLAVDASEPATEAPSWAPRASIFGAGSNRAQLA